ncbi:MAG: RHS repeat-associated core domain-containing protein [Immundisolibacteraceae bacterium]|nr:RHS repeat-associated core domain-containing protein [Immundisolibacteraceae bacterium]
MIEIVTPDVLGRISGLITKNSSNQNFRSWTYDHDDNGNIDYRKDNIRNFSETFGFDDLNRLTSSTFGNQTYSYASNQGGDLGNLTSKTGFGDLLYNDTRPHAVSNTVVSGVQSADFEYDLNGNLIKYLDRELSYDSLNKLIFIKDDEKASSFFYSPSGSLLRKGSFEYTLNNYKRNSETIWRIGNTRELISETIFVDGLYEVVKENNEIKKRHLINVGSKTIAIYTDNESISDTTHYLHTDHLGSTDIITNGDGTAVIESMSFDSWGRRRKPVDWQYSNFTASSITDRGYTSHRQIDSFGLVHMKGRVYDPLLGRFLSPDPIVQNTYDLQAYNSYAYVRNNPLSFTDPSGYSWISRKWHQLKHGVGKFTRKFAVPLLGMYLTGGFGSGLHFSSFWAGATSGAAGAALNGGNIGKGALTGAFAASAFRFAGHGSHGLKAVPAHFIAGAASGGFSAAVYGGNVGQSALSGGLSAAIGKRITLSNRFKGVDSGQFHLGQFAATAGAGGLASALSGGDFFSGANNSAMGYVFNQLGDKLEKELGTKKKKVFVNFEDVKERAYSLAKRSSRVEIVSFPLMLGHPELYFFDHNNNVIGRFGAAPVLGCHVNNYYGEDNGYNWSLPTHTSNNPIQLLQAIENNSIANKCFTCITTMGPAYFTPSTRYIVPTFTYPSNR